MQQRQRCLVDLLGINVHHGYSWQIGNPAALRLRMTIGLIVVALAQETMPVAVGNGFIFGIRAFLHTGNEGQRVGRRNAGWRYEVFGDGAVT
jgi:hypothetical protein